MLSEIVVSTAPKWLITWIAQTDRRWDWSTRRRRRRRRTAEEERKGWLQQKQFQQTFCRLFPQSIVAFVRCQKGRGCAVLLFSRFLWALNLQCSVPLCLPSTRHSNLWPPPTISSYIYIYINISINIFLYLYIYTLNSLLIFSIFIDMDRGQARALRMLRHGFCFRVGRVTEARSRGACCAGTGRSGAGVNLIPSPGCLIGHPRRPNTSIILASMQAIVIGRKIHKRATRLVANGPKRTQTTNDTHRTYSVPSIGWSKFSFTSTHSH